MLYLGVCCLVLFTAFNTSSSFLTTIYPTSGFLSFVILYFGFGVGSIMAVPVGRYVRRRQIFWAATTYSAFLAGINTDSTPVFLLLSLLIGFGGGCLWINIGLYIVRTSALGPVPLGRLTSIFYGVWMGSTVAGSALAIVAVHLGASVDEVIWLMTGISGLALVLMYFIKELPDQNELEPDTMSSSAPSPTSTPMTEWRPTASTCSLSSSSSPTSSLSTDHTSTNHSSTNHSPTNHSSTNHSSSNPPYESTTILSSSKPESHSADDTCTQYTEPDHVAASYTFNNPNYKPAATATAAAAADSNSHTGNFSAHNASVLGMLRAMRRSFFLIPPNIIAYGLQQGANNVLTWALLPTFISSRIELISAVFLAYGVASVASSFMWGYIFDRFGKMVLGLVHFCNGIAVAVAVCTLLYIEASWAYYIIAGVLCAMFEQGNNNLVVTLLNQVSKDLADIGLGYSRLAFSISISLSAVAALYVSPYVYVGICVVELVVAAASNFVTLRGGYGGGYQVTWSRANDSSSSSNSSNSSSRSRSGGDEEGEDNDVERNTSDHAYHYNSSSGNHASNSSTESDLCNGTPVAAGYGFLNGLEGGTVDDNDFDDRDNDDQGLLVDRD